MTSVLLMTLVPASIPSEGVTTAYHSWCLAVSDGDAVVPEFVTWTPSLNQSIVVPDSGSLSASLYVYDRLSDEVVVAPFGPKRRLLAVGAEFGAAPASGIG
jgi:hypothetical protein